jgi:type II secretory pathway predicted ATPase ExeA
MVRDPARPTAPPFDGVLEPAAFHAGPPQEEALARLEWLASEGQRCGLVVGAEGTGKSHVAAVAARLLGGLGAEVAVLSLRGLAAGDWIDLLLDRLPLDAASRAEPLRPWLKLENRLRENALMERTTALVFDDLDRAPDDARAGIARLVTAAEPRFSRTLVVATCAPAGLACVPAEVRDRAAVRIELEPWTEPETAAYLAWELARVGGDPDHFTPQAAATLARFTGGVPRAVGRLARLALAAADGDAAEQVDAATVERAWRELFPAGVQAAGPAEPAEPTANARVRVVRRLGG